MPVSRSRARKIQFWFEFASTYSYPAAMRIEYAAAQAGIALECASSEETKQRLRAQGDEAAALGIFGAPSFVVGRELFWGNDRLNQALAWATAP